LKDATTDSATIQDWWSKWPTANIGIRTGKESGLFVLDIDLGGEGSLQHLQSEIGPFPDTVEQHTGSGGRHLVFRHSGTEIRNSASKLGRGLDVRGDGGYFVAAPSRNANGSYVWELSSRPGEVELAEVPPGILRLLESSGHENQPINDQIREGQRNDAVFRLACNLRHKGLSVEEIIPCLQAVNSKRCDPRLPESEIRAIANSTLKYEQGNILADQVPERCSDTIVSGTSERRFELIPTSAAQLIKESPEVEWQIDGMHPVGGSMLLAGDAGIGKTWLTLDLALAVDQGSSWLGHFGVKKGRVLIIDEENAVALLKKRLQKLLRAAQMPEDGSSLGIEFLASKGINLSDPPCVEALGAVLEEKKPDLVIVDSLVRIHRGNENDAGEMARLFGVIKPWMNSFGCSFVFCHHRRKPGPMGGDAANMFRGSSEIRAFVDTHLDLRKNRGEEALTVEQSKSRYDGPVTSFSVEILDVGEGTEIRYKGEATNQTKAKLDDAFEFIRTLVSDGEWHGRPEILKKGDELRLKQHTLDTARKLLIESEEVEAAPKGREAGVRLKQRSDVPNTIVSEQRQEDFEEGQLALLKSEFDTEPYSDRKEDYNATISEA